MSATFKLKSYQVQALSALSSFLEQCRDRAIEEVFTEVAMSLGARNPKYHNEFGEHVPCVCIRVPTGGGKTVIASAAIQVIDEEWRQSGAPVVLWLTPSDAITTQTLSALQDCEHPYRLMLSKAYKNVKVVSVADVSTLQASDFDQACIVIVSTIQTFNIANTDQRRVYDNNEAYQPYFANLSPAWKSRLEKIQPEDLHRLDKDGNPISTPLTEANIGEVKASLANLLALQQPIVIVDEAHNNRTNKFFTTLKRINPSAILELTATPDRAYNNTIFQVSAWELKAADMIKLPIVLQGYDTEWQACLAESVTLRMKLAQQAEEAEVMGDEYVRPILLIQAQAKGQTPSPELVKQHLLKLNIDESEIAIATGEQKDLDGVDLFSESCPINYVITVKALKEGWDCSFAYVLCSLQNIHSSKDVEQLLGRVMRMPYAKRRALDELNRAYASVVSNDTYTTAQCLKERLVDSMGFDEISADQMIEEKPQKELIDRLPPGGLFKPSLATVVQTQKSESELRKVIEQAGLGEVVVVENTVVQSHQLSNNGSAKQKESGFSKTTRLVVRVSAAIQTEQIEQLTGILTSTETKKDSEKNQEGISALRNELARDSARLNQKRVPNFTMPMLCFNDEGTVRPVTGLCTTAWVPSAQGLTIDFSPTEKVIQVTMDFSSAEGSNKHLEVRTVQSHVNSEAPRLFNSEVTENELIRSIAMDLSRPDVTAIAMTLFVKNVIKQKVMNKPSNTLSVLLRNRIALTYAFRKLLDKCYETMMKTTYGAQLDLACEDTEAQFQFRFHPDFYEARKPYIPATGYDFKKHYYPVIDDLAHYTASGKEKEEYLCGLAIELCEHVNVWVRNVPKSPYSFKLPLPGGTNFYPDFVALLNDGRVLVVEYKGSGIVSTDDTETKVKVGQAWEKASGGRGLFLLATHEDEFGRSSYQQIMNKIQST